ncbi:hypothetical protein B0H19DRAFT_1237451 [Mycena capillaripes]|nr:hypothetical protein B0H19DRAFT_1237451 [Mycena capillaripes]
MHEAARTPKPARQRKTQGVAIEGAAHDERGDLVRCAITTCAQVEEDDRAHRIYCRRLERKQMVHGRRREGEGSRRSSLQEREQDLKEAHRTAKLERELSRRGKKQMMARTSVDGDGIYDTRSGVGTSPIALTGQRGECYGEPRHRGVEAFHRPSRRQPAEGPWVYTKGSRRCLVQENAPAGRRGSETREKQRERDPREAHRTAKLERKVSRRGKEQEGEMMGEPRRMQMECMIHKEERSWSGRSARGDCPGAHGRRRRENRRGRRHQKGKGGGGGVPSASQASQPRARGRTRRGRAAAQCRNAGEGARPEEAYRTPKLGKRSADEAAGKEIMARTSEGGDGMHDTRSKKRGRALAHVSSRAPEERKLSTLLKGWVRKAGRRKEMIAHRQAGVQSLE